MGFMDTVRSGSESFVFQGLLVVTIVSFVFWGAGGQKSSTQDMAVVDGDRITDTELNQVLRRVARSRGNAMSDEESAMLRAQVLDSLIEKKVMLHEAKRLGVAVSDDEINYAVFKTDAFRDENGKFSMSIYETTLERIGMDRSEYEHQMREELLLQKLRDIALMGVQVSDAEVKQSYIDDNTQIAVSWVAIDEIAMMSAVTVSQEEIDAFAASQAARIKSAYDEQLERRFKLPRKAAISTILMRTDIEGLSREDVYARVEAVRAEVVAGLDFTEAAKIWSEDVSAVNGGNLGLMAEDQMDPVVAESVFAAGPNQITAIVEANRVIQFLQVREVEEARVISLEEATPMLARELIAAERAPEAATNFAEQVLAEWKANGAPPTELLAARGMQVETEDKLTLKSREIGSLGAAPEVMLALRSGKSGEVLPTVFNVDGRRVVIQITQRTDADLTAYEDEAPLLRQRLRTMEQMEFVQQWRDGLVASAEIQRMVK